MGGKFRAYSPVQFLGSTSDYGLIHQFLTLVIEGDELYTKVHHHTAASDPQGWTIVLMERSSRFLWELDCGSKDEQLFKAALERSVLREGFPP